MGNTKKTYEMTMSLSHFSIDILRGYLLVNQTQTHELGNLVLQVSEARKALMLAYANLQKDESSERLQSALNEALSSYLISLKESFKDLQTITAESAASFSIEDCLKVSESIDEVSAVFKGTLTETRFQENFESTQLQLNDHLEEHTSKSHFVFERRPETAFAEPYVSLVFNDFKESSRKILLGKGANSEVYYCHFNGTPYVIRQQRFESPATEFEIINAIREDDSEGLFPKGALSHDKKDEVLEAGATLPRFNTAQMPHRILDLLNGLQFLHNRNIFHRDLKPANLIQLPNGKVAIIDFGEAIRAETGLGDLQGGTHSYLPPEHLASGVKQSEAKFDQAKRDVWALGITVYEMIFGELPYGDISGHKRRELIERIQQEGWKACEAAYSEDGTYQFKKINELNIPEVQKAKLNEFFLKSLDPKPQSRATATTLMQLDLFQAMPEDKSGLRMEEALQMQYQLDDKRTIAGQSLSAMAEYACNLILQNKNPHLDVDRKNLPDQIEKMLENFMGDVLLAEAIHERVWKDVRQLHMFAGYDATVLKMSPSALNLEEELKVKLDNEQIKLLAKCLDGKFDKADKVKMNEMLTSEQLVVKAIGQYIKENYQRFQNKRQEQLALEIQKESKIKPTLAGREEVEIAGSFSFKPFNNLFEKLINNYTGSLEQQALVEDLKRGNKHGLGHSFFNEHLQKYFADLGLVEGVAKAGNPEASVKTLYQIFNEGNAEFGVNKNPGKAAIVLALAGRLKVFSSNDKRNAETNARYLIELGRHFEAYGDLNRAYDCYDAAYLAYRQLKQVDAKSLKVLEETAEIANVRLKNDSDACQDKIVDILKKLIDEDPKNIEKAQNFLMTKVGNSAKTPKMEAFDVFISQKMQSSSNTNNILVAIRAIGNAITNFRTSFQDEKVNQSEHIIYLLEITQEFGKILAAENNEDAKPLINQLKSFEQYLRSNEKSLELLQKHMFALAKAAQVYSETKNLGLRLLDDLLQQEPDNLIIKLLHASLSGHSAADLVRNKISTLLELASQTDDLTVAKDAVKLLVDNYPRYKDEPQDEGQYVKAVLQDFYQALNKEPYSQSEADKCLIEVIKIYSTTAYTRQGVLLFTDREKKLSALSGAIKRLELSDEIRQLLELREFDLVNQLSEAKEYLSDVIKTPKTTTKIDFFYEQLRQAIKAKDYESVLALLANSAEMTLQIATDNRYQDAVKYWFSEVTTFLRQKRPEKNIKDEEGERPNPEYANQLSNYHQKLVLMMKAYQPGWMELQAIFKDAFELLAQENHELRLAAVNLLVKQYPRNTTELSQEARLMMPVWGQLKSAIKSNDKEAEQKVLIAIAEIYSQAAYGVNPDTGIIDAASKLQNTQKLMAEDAPETKVSHLIRARKLKAENKLIEAQEALQLVFAEDEISMPVSAYLDKIDFLVREKQYIDALKQLAVLKEQENFHLYEAKSRQLFTNIYNNLPEAIFNTETVAENIELLKTMVDFHNPEQHACEFAIMSLITLSLQTHNLEEAQKAVEKLAQHYPVSTKERPTESALMQPLWADLHEALTQEHPNDADVQKAQFEIIKTYFNQSFLKANEMSVHNAYNKLSLMLKTVKTDALVAEDVNQFEVLKAIADIKYPQALEKFTVLGGGRSDNELGTDALLFKARILLQQGDYQKTIDLLNLLKTKDGFLKVSDYARSLFQDALAKVDLDPLKLLQEKINYDCCKAIDFQKAFNNVDVRSSKQNLQKVNELYQQYLEKEARAVCQLSGESIAAINTEDLALARTDSKKYPNTSLTQASALFNKFSVLIIEEVVNSAASAENAEDKITFVARTMEKWLLIAKIAKEKYGDFNFYQAVNAAFGNAIIFSRLSVAKDSLSPQARAVLNDLDYTFATKGNNKNYREIIEKQEGRLVPFLGILCTDATFLNDTLPSNAKTPEQKLNALNQRSAGLMLQVNFDAIKTVLVREPLLDEANSAYHRIKAFEIHPNHETLNYNKTFEIQPRENPPKTTDVLTKQPLELAEQPLENILKNKQYQNEATALLKQRATALVDVNNENIKVLIESISDTPSEISKEIIANLQAVHERTQALNEALSQRLNPSDELRIQITQFQREINQLLKLVKFQQQYSSADALQSPSIQHELVELLSFKHGETDFQNIRNAQKNIVTALVDKTDIATEFNKTLIGFIEYNLPPLTNLQEQKVKLDNIKLSFDNVQKILDEKPVRILGFGPKFTEKQKQLIVEGRFKAFLEGRKIWLMEAKEAIQQAKQQLEDEKAKLKPYENLSDEALHIILGEDKAFNINRAREKYQTLKSEISKQQIELNDRQMELSNISRDVQKFETRLQSEFIRGRFLKTSLGWATQTLRENQEVDIFNMDKRELERASQKLSDMIDRANSMLSSIPTKNTESANYRNRFERHQKIIEQLQKTLRKLLVDAEAKKTQIEVALREIKRGEIALAQHRVEAKSSETDTSKTNKAPFKRMRSSSFFTHKPAEDSLEFSTSGDCALKISFEPDTKIPTANKYTTVTPNLDVLSKPIPVSPRKKDAFDTEPLLQKTSSMIYSENGKGVPRAFEKDTKSGTLILKPADVAASNKQAKKQEYASDKATVELMVKHALEEDHEKPVYLEGTLAKKAAIWLLAHRKADGGKGPDIFVKDKKGEWKEVSMRSMVKYALEINHKASWLKEQPRSLPSDTLIIDRENSFKPPRFGVPAA